MVETIKNTEKEILASAYQEFLEKGFEGARMQSIANRAGINKALLHYYFRSKENLFNAVVNEVTKALPLTIHNILNSNDDFLKKIEIIVESYIDFISKNPQLPRFIINEITRNPELIASAIGNHSGIKEMKIINQLSNLIDQEVKKGTIKPIEPYQFMINLLSLCVFPFIAKPLIQHMLLNDGTSFQELIMERKQHVSKFIIDALRK